MGEVSTREMLQELADRPLGLEDHGGCEYSALVELTKRISKIWLPAGKRSANSREERVARKALREQQIDIEEAIEAAGGHRGTLRA